MPAPFKRRPNQVVNPSPAVVVLRPHLAIAIASIASHWAKLEQTLGLAFKVLLAGKDPTAFEAYHELFEISLRHKMFLAEARARSLPVELINEAIGLHKLVDKAANGRNTVVHGIWAICDSLPDSLLLCNPTGIYARVDAFWTKFHDSIYSRKKIEARWSFNLSVDEYTEYRLDDFHEIANRIMAVELRAQAYWQKVQERVLAAELKRRPPPMPR